jgi:hypothetical protein
MPELGSLLPLKCVSLQGLHALLDSRPSPFPMPYPTRDRTRNRVDVWTGTSTFVFMNTKNSLPLPTLSSPPSEAYKEARKSRRIPVDLPCLFSADGPHEWSGTAVNLSREGCAIRSTTPVQKGQYLCVLLFLSANQPPIEVGVAPVRWSANEQFGVEFITLTPRDATRLQNFLTLLGA